MEVMRCEDGGLGGAYAVVLLAWCWKTLSAGVDELNGAVFECFDEGENEDHGSSVVAKTADIMTADHQPVLGFGVVRC